MKQWKKNFIRTIPVLTGYLVLGASFGIVMQSKGFDVLWSIGMSAAVFAGSMQFVAVDLLATAAGIITTALTTLMVNARHLFYGVSMVDRYRDVGKAKPYLIFALTDETYSIVCADETLSNRDLLQITLLDHLYWIAGSAIGGGIGALIPWDFKGVDFALTALFISIFTDQWSKTKDHLPAILGASLSSASLLIFGADRFLIPAMLAITLALAVLKRVRKGAEA
ncbi:MAG: AzlC family ABC transporter permease [Oscillospiraceae bacterium]|nr:AzlC family ABC transporter permease [Oscillospiraceae bacterium]